MITAIRPALGAALALVTALALVETPALARTAYVQDGAQLFSAQTISGLNTKIADFNQQTGKEVVVVTVPSLDGSTVEDVAEKTFAQQQVNGVLFMIAKAEKKDIVVGDRASRAFFPSGSFDAVRQAMRGYFRTADYDSGITNGVDLVLSQYRSHEGSLRGAGQRAAVPSSQTASGNMFGGSMSIIWLVLILIAGFLIIRAIFRAISGPRMMPPGYGQGGGPMMGGPGYGGGYGGGFGGGGGGFFSGLLGGLGGAFIGNELFGRHDGGGNYMDQSGIAGGGMGGGADASGWQSDAGQADMGNASSGDFGSSGGGFDGGGGGFDGGGGGGDSGGGW